MNRISALAAALLLLACGVPQAKSGAPAAGEPETPVAGTVGAEPASDAPAADLVVAEGEVAPSEPAASAKWTADKGKSRIEFTGLQVGTEFTGSFSSFDMSIVFDPDNLAAARIKATIDMASAKTGDRQRDDALPGKDWFSVSEFPAAVFESSDIRAAGTGYEARGTLTLHGVSRDLTLPFSLDISGGRAVADGSVSLVRSDFGVGQGEFAGGEWVGLDVKVSVHIEADG